MATFVETLRRFYWETVYRRSRVRVVAAAEPSNKPRPVFLIGVYRSGTTLLRYIVDSHSNIACPPESDFISALNPLLATGRMQAGLEHMGFDRMHVVGRIREFCGYFHENYAISRNKQRWADKTPEYVDMLDFLRLVFPSAQFVMIYRHGFDQAHSFTRGGKLDRSIYQGFGKDGEDRRAAAVRYWVEKVEIMLEFEEKNRSRCHRILYEELCEQPEVLLRQLFDFLNEPWEPAVLQFHRFEHDIGAEDGRVGATRGFQVSKGHYEKWSPELRQACGRIAANQLEQLGYSIDADGTWQEQKTNHKAA